MQRRLQAAGYQPAAAEEADLIILNTCTVTHRADQDARRLARRLHRSNGEARLLVTGCYADRAPEVLSQITGVHRVIAKEDLLLHPELIENSLEVNQQDSEYPLPGPVQEHTRPFVKIQDGCDSRCSYCIVPLVRGAARSVPPEKVAAQVEILIREGYQEVVLTGIHLGSYGKKLSGKPTLASMVHHLLQLPGLGRLRLSGIEPMEFSKDLIRLAAQSPLLAPHFHLPLQSGSAEVLQRMRRPYTPEEYRQVIEQIRSEIPDAGLGADVLVGFPGETEAQHQESFRLVEDSPLNFLHVFSYSSRPGTPAASWESLPMETVRRRSRDFHLLAKEKRSQFVNRFLGRTLRALTLKPLPDKAGIEVLTGNYLTVRLPNVHWPSNQWIDVQIDQATPNELIGHKKLEHPIA